MLSAPGGQEKPQPPADVYLLPDEGLTAPKSPCIWLEMGLRAGTCSLHDCQARFHLVVASPQHKITYSALHAHCPPALSRQTVHRPQHSDNPLKLRKKRQSGLRALSSKSWILASLTGPPCSHPHIKHLSTSEDIDLRALNNETVYFPAYLPSLRFEHFGLNELPKAT